MGPLASGILAASLLGGCCLNLATVEEGRLYRSGQPDPEQLERLIAELGLRTVVCLRHQAPRDAWYRAEQALCAARGVRHVTATLSGYRLPRPGEVLRLLDALEQGPYPMLLHCRGGADRAGLASAVYRIAILRHPVADADDELSLRFGHLGWITGTEELQDFLDLYAAHGAGRSLRQWVEEDYPRHHAERTGGRHAQ